MADSQFIAFQAKIQACINSEVWEDREQFKVWLFAQFGVRSTKDLTHKQQSICWIHLRFFLGEIKRPSFYSQSPWLIQPKQKYTIEQLQLALNWSDEQLHNFIKRQLGVHTMVNALSKKAASILISGLDKTLTHFKNKQKNEH